MFNIVDDYLGVKRVALRVAEWLRKSVHESGIDEIVKLNWNDVTRRIDWLAEEMVIKLLEEEGYGGIVVTEERGVVHLGDGEENFIFIVDPLDGSNNYLAGIPYASVSIGVAEMKNHPSLNDVVYGIIASVFTEEVYEAKKGAGAYLNGSRLPLRRDFYLGDFILAYLNAEAYDIFRKVEEVIGPFKLRSLGSASLDICLVASGRATAFIDIRARLRITDIAAAQLVLKEAGGMIYDKFGSELDLNVLKDRNVRSIVAFPGENAYEKYKFIFDIIREEIGSEN